MRLVLLSFLWTAFAQTLCPQGTYWAGTLSDGTPDCRPCEPGLRNCISEQITTTPTASATSCETYTCTPPKVLVHNKWCYWNITQEPHAICEANSIFNPTTNLCVFSYPLTSADEKCKDGYTYGNYNNTIYCIYKTEPFYQCPQGFKLYETDKTNLCYLVEPAICKNSTETSLPCMKWVCNGGIEPTHTSVFTEPLCIYSKYDAIANSEGYLTCPHGGTLWEKYCYTFEHANSIPCNQTELLDRPTLTATEDPSVSNTPKPVPSGYASPREISPSGSVTPKEMQRESASATQTPKEMQRESASATQTPKEVQRESASATQTPKEVPRKSPSSTPVKTSIVGCTQYVCREPSILVAEKFCYWNETIDAKPRCQENDVYNKDNNEKMCVKYYIPEKNTTDCKEGYRFVIHEENSYCIQKYEPNFNNCPEGFRYHIDEKGVEKCSKVTDAICVEFSVSPLLQSSPSSSNVPKKSQTSTATAKPSPRECTDPKNPRCIRLDSIINEISQNAALSPLPSRKPAATIAAIVSRLPLPSPFRRPPTESLDTSTIPQYIPSRITFQQGDSAVIQRPEKIQEIQASLACTLRIPLEKVLIKTIYSVTLSTGVREQLSIDPTQYMLNSAGVIECFSFNATSTRLSERRNLQKQDKQIDIDYLIINPPVEIAVLNQTEFTQILEESQVVKTLAQSIGSNDISSAIMFESYLVADPSPSPSLHSEKSSSFPNYGIGILGAAGGIIGIGILMFVGHRLMKSKRRSQRRSPLEYSNPITQTQNPIRNMV